MSELRVVFLLLESALRPPYPTPSACVNENEDNYFSKVWLRRKLLLKNEGECSQRQLEKSRLNTALREEREKSQEDKENRMSQEMRRTKREK